jgi:hypothetical protein
VLNTARLIVSPAGFRPKASNRIARDKQEISAASSRVEVL